MMLMKIVKDCAKNLNLKNVKTKEKNFLKKQKQNKTEKKQRNTYFNDKRACG